jgi:hypothetical protein
MLEKMVPRLPCVNTLGTDTFLPSELFNWSMSYAFGNTMIWGWLLKAVTSNGWSTQLILEYTFLRLASTQITPFLLVGSCRRFLMREFSLWDRVLHGMSSTRAQSCWLGTPVTLSGKSALKMSITLAALHFSAVTFVQGFSRLQSRSIRQEDCLQSNF